MTDADAAANKCPTCGEDIDAAASSHTCPGCNRAVHAWCGEAASEEGYGQKRLCLRCKGDGEQTDVGDANANAERAATDGTAGRAKTRGGYQKKRKVFDVPEGFKLVQVSDVVKPKPGTAMSKAWDHVDTYSKTEGTSVSYLCICKCCGSQLANTNLRATVILAHFEQKAASDHAHLAIMNLIRVTSRSEQTRLPIAVVKPNQLEQLVEWLTDTLIPPSSLESKAFADYQRTLDPTYKTPSYETIYKELERQVNARKDMIK